MLTKTRSNFNELNFSIKVRQNNEENSLQNEMYKRELYRGNKMKLNE